MKDLFNRCRKIETSICKENNLKYTVLFPKNIAANYILISELIRKNITFKSGNFNNTDYIFVLTQDLNFN